MSFRDPLTLRDRRLSFHGGFLWEALGDCGWGPEGQATCGRRGVVVGGALSLGFIPQTPQQQGCPEDELCRGGGDTLISEV